MQTGYSGGFVITGRYSKKDFWQIHSSIAILKLIQELIILIFSSVKEAAHAHATSRLKHHSNHSLFSVVLKFWKKDQGILKPKSHSDICKNSLKSGWVIASSVFTTGSSRVSPADKNFC